MSFRFAVCLNRTKHCLYIRMLHRNARCEYYPLSEQRRFCVPDEKVPWSADYSEYDPPEFTAEVVKKGPVWADPDIALQGDPSVKPLAFNRRDGLINRISFTGDYKLQQNVPLNPFGRTGLKGRGLLGKWGPNHAADPIVTRWLRNENGETRKDAGTGKAILQFVAVLRKDSGEWAIPGGMVDAGETVSVTLRREFGEEALNTLNLKAENRKNLREEIAALFSRGEVIYQGYVDDPRNTDNAWMETVAVNFHDENGKSVSQLPLQAGDDAGSVRWMNASSELKLYANHISFLQKVVVMRHAHW